MSIKLLHLANARLGTACATLGMHGREHRAQMLDTLLDLADLACAERVQAVLISGDLFDCAVPSTRTLDTVRRFFAQLQSAGVPSVVLPGGRDSDGVFDPTRRPDGLDVCPGAKVLTPHQPAVHLEQVDLVVRALTLHTLLSTDVELPAASGPARALAGKRTVGLAYQPSAMPDDLAHLDRVLAGSGLCYLGIGGDPSFGTWTGQHLTICSPGVPEPIDWGQEQGSVAVVHLEDEGLARVERRRTGAHSLIRRELVIASDTAAAIAAKIERLAHPTRALEVVLTGSCPFDVAIDPAALEAEFAPKFFHLRIVDRTVLALPDPEHGAFSQGSIVGSYARIMQDRLRDADEEQAPFEREAYKLGLSLLQGGGVAR